MAVTKYLGIDWGEKRIGLATADSEVRLALPLRTVSNLADVLAVAAEEETDMIIIGAPRKMNGQSADNPLWRVFLEQLRDRSACPVEEVDERLTSRAADALEGGQAEKAGRDEIAAALILQAYLDRA